MGVQIIRTESGEELVVLPRREYIALLARAGDEAAEDEMTRILGEEFKAALARGEDVALPEAVWEAIKAGESPVKVLRKHRGLTQAELAAAAGVSQGYVAELEAGRKSGAPDTLKALARALGVPLDVLVE
jgi:DNA-binding XRE family transcriptional regulator